MKYLIFTIFIFISINPCTAIEKDRAYFAGGCFWCVEESFEKLNGVEEVISGYSGGRTKNPTYKEVTFGNTGHFETVEIIYDKEVVDKWTDKNWPFDMLSEIEWLVKEQAKNNNFLKKGNLILTGAYGFPVPINEKKLIQVTSSAFGDVEATFN